MKIFEKKEEARAVDLCTEKSINIAIKIWNIMYYSSCPLLFPSFFSHFA
jgi:hypothetical protein